MSANYQVLLDHHAAPSEATAIANALRDVLIAEELVFPTPNADCVYGGVGFPPGPRFASVYSLSENETPYWQLRTNGVRFCIERYVNFFGFVVFEQSQCPNCHRTFSGDHELMDVIYDCVAAFINDDRLDDIVCPACRATSRCNHWLCVPDLGFCHLAIEFWNWPPFDATGWRLDIPELLERRTGRKLAIGWGHM